jgi:NADH-quinone oxidoreductase subunit A
MTGLVAYLLLFVAVGVGFIFIHLVAGKLFRPAKPDPDKLTIYECGEPTIGTAWVQFDLRYYVVALLFVIFDVEVAFFFPWAVVFGKANELARTDPDFTMQQRLVVTQELDPTATAVTDAGAQAAAARSVAWIALLDIGVFFGVLLVGFAYLWRRGDLNWVRSLATERGAPAEELPPSRKGAELVGAGPW